MIGKNSPTIFRNTCIILSLILGIFFRFENLDKKLIWHDEVGTRLFSAGLQVDDWSSVLYTGQVLDVDLVRSIHNTHKKDAIDILRGLAQDDPHHPPLYYFLAGIWGRIFSDDIVTLRMLSAIFSLLMFPGIFWFCRELFQSQRIAWTASALLAVSPFFVLYAQEAREYTLWFALILLSNAALIRAIRLTELKEETNSTNHIFISWTLCTFITALALYTSLATATVILSQAVFILFREKFRFNKITLMSAGALSLGVVIFAPWAYALAMRWEAFQISMAWSKMIIIPNSSLLSILALNISRIVIDFWPDYQGIESFVAVGLASLFVLTAICFLIKYAPFKKGALVLFLIIVPISIVLVPDLVLGGIRSVSARYLAPSLIGILVAIAYLLGAESESGKLRIQNTVFIVLLVLGIASCFLNSKQEVVWTKGISYNLPKVADMINQSQTALVVGNRERHHPGNLLALSYLFKDETKMQFLATEQEYELPQNFSGIFLYSPTDQFRKALEKNENVTTRLLMEDLHLQLWIVEPIVIR